MGEDMQHLDRAQRDVDELVNGLCRQQNQGLLHGMLDGYRTAAENLVSQGWTRLGPGEQVTLKPTPRNEELSLRDELAATIVGVLTSDKGPVALAEYLISDGWVKLAAGQRLVTPMSADEATQIVARALLRWEDLKDDAAARGKGPNWAREAAKKWAGEGAEVSADASELTSGVKSPNHEKRILAVFAATEGPLEYTEAYDQAAEAPVRFFPDAPWHAWNAAFRSLEDRGLIEALPAVEGEIKRYALTQAGRSLHELDGVER